MNNKKIYKMEFSKIYPLLVNKAVKKGREPKTDQRCCLWSSCRRHRGSSHAGNPFLDKLVDELAKGKKMEKILRAN